LITNKTNLQTFSVSELETDLYSLVDAFLLDKVYDGCRTGTIKFYREKMNKFVAYCKAQVIVSVNDLTPIILRQFLLYLNEQGHNPGGVHAHFRTLRTFLNWYEYEYEPKGWRNPIHKVKSPKLPTEPLESVDLDDIKDMIATCDNSFHGLRDKAILYSLLDTGARAQEFLDMNRDDLDLASGNILIRQGKGAKFRYVLLGKKSRRVVRKYLKNRGDDCEALWISQQGERLTYWGLRQIARRRATAAKVNTPPLHSFRRAFALNMLRAGVNVFSLQKLMGHADMQMLNRYLAQSTEDIAAAHKIGSPVDMNGL
jgi:integrase/recombinase XerC/integrase/recombinase XerD